MWIIGTLGIYAFYNLNLGFPLHTSIYDTWVNSWDVPSVWDYLFGSGNSSGDILSGELLSGANTTGNLIIYPTWYLEEFNKALLILQNDSNVNTYIDTDNLISSWFDGITINNPWDTSKPKFTIVWKSNIELDKLYIIWVNKEGAYHFEPITSENGLFSYTIDANNGNIKPWANTYYILGRTSENKYIFQYIKIKTAEWSAFYADADTICILDICSDPALAKTFVSWSNSILQQSPDGKKVIQIIPDSSITIAFKENSTQQATIKKIKKIGNYYQKTLISGWEPSITQKFIDKDGNPINASTAWITIPSKLSFGNIKYGTPKINFENSNLTFNKVAKIDAWFIIEDTKKNLKLANEFAFALADWNYVIYTLDNSSLKVINSTNSDNTYKIIPKVVNWMTNPIVYTVPSTDIGMHDTISSYFKWSVIEKSSTCTNNKPNPDPNAKFWLFPIDGQYDVVGLWNCYGIK